MRQHGPSTITEFDSDQTIVADEPANPVAPRSTEASAALDKGRRVLDLCIEHEKRLCVMGFIDSQIERGGEHLAVLAEMRRYLESRLADSPPSAERRIMRELHDYIDQALPGVPDGTG